MRTIIVEDEPNNAKLLHKYLDIYAKNLKVCCIVSTVGEAVLAIKEHDPELIFLDVELPDGTGFDVVRQTTTHNYQVIFCTGHSHYALKAIKMSALDYLMKPIDAEELTQAIKKVRLTKNRDKHSSLVNLVQDAPIDEGERKITLRVQDGMHLVQLKEIILIKGDNNYTEFYLVNNKEPLIISSHLKEFEGLLPISLFFRSHRSYIINLKHLSFWDKKEGDLLMMKNGLSAPLSRRKKNDLLERL